MIIKKFFSFLFLMTFFIGCSSIGVDKNEKISEYFTMGEATYSSTAIRRGIKNTPSWSERTNIRYTARRLDEVREILGRPVVVSSWFRNKKLNKIVGGSSSSGHRKGMAVDIILKKGSAGKKEYERVKNRLESFDQLIYYPRRGHLHIGFKQYRFQERKQVMVKYN